MKNGFLNKLMAIVGVLAAVYCGWTWYTIAAGIWEPLNRAGEATGPIVYIILTIVFAAVAGLGIYGWVRAGKEK